MKIKFVFVSKHKDFLMKEDDFNSLRNNDSALSIFTEFISDNKIDLPAIYNKQIDESINPNTHTCDFDYLILLHSDVVLNIDSFIQHLQEIDGKYDLIGLAGTKKLNASHIPLNWFTGSNLFTECRYGDVTMVENGKQRRSIYNKEKEIRDTQVVCIDGLCLIISKKLIESGLRFDENIAPFDFYDTDISFQAIFKYKAKVGVMVEPVFHESVGKGILKEQFLEYDKKFKEKWKSINGN